jgi:hypothetical protein
MHAGLLWRSAEGVISVMTQSNAYKPQPIDTTAISLPPELTELTERLAENAHDHWALQRMSDGWVYGPRRDDAGKKHPDLVPYAQLSEAEKQYDRRVAMETIKAILAIGYRIGRP